MDDSYSKVKDKTFAAAGNISAFGEEEFANERDRDCHNYCIGNKYDEQYADKIAESLSTLNGMTKDVLKYLKEYPSEDRLISILSCLLRGDIQRIENLLQYRHCDLEKIMKENCDIRKELSSVNKLINSPSHGLCEITKEVRNIEKEISNITRFCPNVTSGSVIVEDPQTTQVLVAVKNRNLLARTVRIKVLRDDICPATVLINTCLLVSGCCSNAITVPLNCAVSYQIEVFDLVPGMTVSSIELDVCKRRVKCSRLTSSQFFCLSGSCP